MKIFIQLCIILIFSSTTIFLSSCKKDQEENDPVELTIKGIVKESQTNTLLKNIRVYVYILTGSGFNTSKEVIGSDRTDVNGEYEISINTTKNSFIYIVTEGGEFDYISPSDYTHKVSSSFFKYDVGLLIPGYASIKFINNTPQDSVSINVSSPQGNGATARNGIVNSFTSFFYFPAQIETEVHIKVIRNGKENIDTLTLNIPQWDTTYIVKNF
jgi:hypothetical protein